MNNNKVFYSDKDLLKIQNLSFSYRKAALTKTGTLKKRRAQLSPHHHELNHKVLDDLSLTLKKGETAAIGGPSGCGKSTLLRLIAGFETPHSGEIYLENTLVSNNRTCVEPEKRKIGFVFQDHALFPQMTVEKNIRFGIAHLHDEEQQEKTIEILHTIKLSHFAHRYPDELSIGQIQRVALARALVTNPVLLLLDEPFSSIDKDTSFHLIEELREIKHKDTTILMVTHEAFEALYLADTIMLLNDGKIMQGGNPEELYLKPHNQNVATYFDEVNFMPIQQSVCGQLCSPCGFVDKKFIENYQQFIDEKNFYLCVRPHMLKIRSNTKARYQQENWVVLKKYFMGNHYKIVLKSLHPLFEGLKIIIVQELHSRWPQVNETIQIELITQKLWALLEKSGAYT